jgi:hypothetical protein
MAITLTEFKLMPALASIGVTKPNAAKGTLSTLYTNARKKFCRIPTAATLLQRQPAGRGVITSTLKSEAIEPTASIRRRAVLTGARRIARFYERKRTPFYSAAFKGSRRNSSSHKPMQSAGSILRTGISNA